MREETGEFAGRQVFFDDENDVFVLDDGRRVVPALIGHYDAANAFAWASDDARTSYQSLTSAASLATAAAHSTLSGDASTEATPTGRLPRGRGAVYAVALLLVLVTTAGVTFLLGAHHGEKTTRILFIGNSYTFFNGGIDAQLRGLTPVAKTERVVAGGADLKSQWDNGAALAAIRMGGWDYVVLQDQSQEPVTNAPEFAEYTSRFDQEIRQSGAKTVLLMTWQRPDSVQYGVTTSNLAAAYDAAGTRLGAKVAPAGLAFARVADKNPGLSLCGPDGHPTMAGTYLAACVVYGTLFGRSPRGNHYWASSVPYWDALTLQRAASESLGY